MAERVILQPRIKNTSFAFLESRQFMDCCLISRLGRYPCHRIVLAAQFDFFATYVQCQTDSGISIEFDDGIMSSVIPFLCTGSIESTFSNVDETFVPYSAKSMAKLGPALTPRVFAAVLPSAVARVQTREDLLYHIDCYIGRLDLRDLVDCQGLERLITWIGPEMHLILTRYHCGWISPPAFRRLASKVIDVRRSTIANFQSSCLRFLSRSRRDASLRSRRR
jgi:hypothetical protein